MYEEPLIISDQNWWKWNVEILYKILHIKKKHMHIKEKVLYGIVSFDFTAMFVA